MNSKLDKFFKDKLEGHTLPPSAQAWDKVESHLSKKNKMILWLRAAAAIALLGLLAIGALKWAGYSSKQQELVKEQVPAPVVEPKKEVPAPAKQLAETPSRVKSPSTTKKRQPDPLPLPAEAIEQQVAIVETPTPVETVIPPAVEKPIVIVYSLPTVKKKQAPATPEPAVAEAEKKTGLERVLEIAKDVKNADHPLGDLREKKDEIFALDFRNKNKKNNY